MNDYKSLPREDIKKIVEDIVKDGAVVASHGTSIANAISIMQTGFNYNRTSYVVYSGNEQTMKRYIPTYGWKENFRGDSTNVILHVPKEFCMDLFQMSEERYNEWISRMQSEGRLEQLLTDLTFIGQPEEQPQTARLSSEFSIPVPLRRESHTVPREFVRGSFVWCDERVYLDFKNNPEDALDHLSFIENPNYYNNLSYEQKQEFLKRMREKIFGKYEAAQEESSHGESTQGKRRIVDEIKDRIKAFNSPKGKNGNVIFKTTF